MLKKSALQSISSKAVPPGQESQGTAVLLTFGGVSAQLQGDVVTCAFAEALPKAKNPRGSVAHLFCQCSVHSNGIIGLYTYVRVVMDK
jgi:hypothetical protein